MKCVSEDRQTTESDAVYFVGYKYPVVPRVSQLEWTAGRFCPVLITCVITVKQKSSSYRNICTRLINLHSFSRTCDNMLIFHIIMMNKLLWIQLCCDFSGMMGNLTERFREHSLIFVVCWRPEVRQALCETNVSLRAQTQPVHTVWMRLFMCRCLQKNDEPSSPVGPWPPALVVNASRGTGLVSCLHMTSIVWRNSTNLFPAASDPRALKPVWQQRIIRDTDVTAVLQDVRHVSTWIML